MRLNLQTALENYHALASDVPLRHWGLDERTNQIAAANACGYCHKGKACQHDTGAPGRHLKPLIHQRSSDPMFLRQLKADLDRQIDGLPERPRILFHLRYRIGLTVKEVMAYLGIRRESDYMATHGLHYEAMAIRLLPYFEREAAA